MSEFDNLMTSSSEETLIDRFVFEEQHVLDRFAVCESSLSSYLEAITESISYAHPDLRACILIANANRTEIEVCYSFDLPKSFCTALKGEPIVPNSKGTCGVAMYTGQPAFCADTIGSEKWAADWKKLLLRHNILACHSTPIFDSRGTAIGSVFLCLSEARLISPREQHLAKLSAKLAAAVIDKDSVQSGLQRDKSNIEGELTDARLLQKRSMELAWEEDTAALYQKITDAAVVIMQSQYASMQALHKDQDGNGKLKLLASSGFSQEAQNYWQWVYYNTDSSCGAAYRAGKRIIIPNMAECEFMQGTTNLPVYLDAGIYAAQSTPLYSRAGKLLGMISTHWDHPRSASERDLSLLDILARQAADLIERSQTLDALRHSEERFRALTTATSEVIYRMSPDWTEMYRLDGRDFLSDTGKPITNWIEKYITPEERDKTNSKARVWGFHCAVK